MMMRKHWRSACAILIALALVSLQAVHAADDVLKQVPEKSWGFAAISKVSEVDAKLSKLAQALKLPVPGSPLAMLKMVTRATQGVNDEGTVIAVAYGDEQPVPVLLIPVSDYEAFIGQFAPETEDTKITMITVSGQRSLVAERDDYAVVTGANFRELLEEFLADTSSLEGSAGTFTQWAEDLDAYVVLRRPTMEKGVAVARAGLAEASRSFEKIEDEAQRQQLRSVQQAFGMYDELLAVAEKDVMQFSVGLRISEENDLHLVSQTVAREGSELAKIFADTPSSDRNVLSGLPAGPFIFAFDGTYPEAVMKPLMELSTQMSLQMYTGGAELTEEEQKQFRDDMTAMMSGVKSMALVMGLNKPEESLYSQMYAVMEVEDAPKYLKELEASIESMSKILEKADGPLKPYELGHESVGGVQALRMTTDMSGMIEQSPDENTRSFMKRMFGEDGKLDAYIAATGKSKVAMAYSKDAFTKLVAAQKSGKPGLAADPEIVKATKLLPDDAQWFGFWSPHGTLAIARQFLKANPATENIKLPDFPKTAPIGFAATAKDGTVETDLVVPASVLQEAATYTTTAQQQGPGAPPRQAAPAPVQKRRVK